MIEAIKVNWKLYAIALMMVVTGLFGLQMAAADSAEAHFPGYCGYSYTYHKHSSSLYYYTYYGGGSGSSAWNDLWWWTSSYGWDYAGWSYRDYCYI